MPWLPATYAVSEFNTVKSQQAPEIRRDEESSACRHRACSWTRV